MDSRLLVFQHDAYRASETNKYIEKRGRVNNVEYDYWTGMVTDWGLSETVTEKGLSGNVFRDRGNFLATASGADAENTVKMLSIGSANLLVASRAIKEIAATWPKDSAGSSQ